MSKAALDSDLYGDIYGEDEVPPESPVADPEQASQSPSVAAPAASSSSTRVEEKAVDSTATTLQSSASMPLPAKPPANNAPANASNNANGLSYSAQIAQQFSSYKQSPSQERQLRTLNKPPPVSVPSQQAIATVDTTSPGGPSALASATSADGIFGKKPSEMHDHGKLFIGGLDWGTTDEGLRDYMSQFGKVDAVTIMRDPAGTSRGFAFMTFEDGDSVQAVIGKEHYLDGKLIDPKRAIPREEHLRNTRYFVGGLSPSTTGDTMKEFFAAFGKVVDATVMMDRESQRSKGFGFVTFEDATPATTEALVGKGGLILDDKQIEVKTAQPRSQRDQQRGAPSPSPSTRETFGGMMSSERQAMSASPTSAGAMSMPFMGTQNAQQQMMRNQMGMGMGGMGSGMMGMGGMGGGMNGMGMMGMGMNPMMGMNGMAGMGGMGSMGGMGGAGMGMMNGMNGMGGMGGMMGGMGMGGMGGMGMGGMRMGMNPMMQQRTGMGAGAGGGMMGAGRSGMNGAGGVGPARTMQRGQHNFHPYSR